MTEARSVLLIDDEPQILKSFERSFRKSGFELFTTVDPGEALRRVSAGGVGVIISDYRMEKMTGLEFLRLARERDPEAVRMILSGYADDALIQGALVRQDIHHYLLKPWDSVALARKIEECLPPRGTVWEDV